MRPLLRLLYKLDVSERQLNTLATLPQPVDKCHASTVEGLVNRELAVIVCREVPTNGCHKNWCLGVDNRWPRCPKCGSEWNATLQSRTVKQSSLEPTELGAAIVAVLPVIEEGGLDAVMFIDGLPAREKVITAGGERVYVSDIDSVVPPIKDYSDLMAVLSVNKDARVRKRAVNKYVSEHADRLKPLLTNPDWIALTWDGNPNKRPHPRSSWFSAFMSLHSIESN